MTYYMSFNKDKTPIQTPPITDEKHLSTGMYVRTSQEESVSMTVNTIGTQNSNTFFMGITGNHAKLGKMLGNKATFKSKTQFKILLNCFRAW